MINIEKILKENNLSETEEGYPVSKSGVLRVKDGNGNYFALKTERIDPFQIKLFKTAKEIENELCFCVPKIAKEGDRWVLFEEAKGEMLNDFYDQKPDWCIEISKRIGDDYQKLIQKFQEKNDLGDILEKGKKWQNLVFEKWSAPIIKRNLMSQDEINNLKNDLDEMINKKGENAFGWSHGNIIGDHIIISNEKPYLLDLAVAPRIGKGYYDFLRSLDWFFIKSHDTKKEFEQITSWIDEYLSDFEKEEVKTVFAFRMVGILGWDLIENGVDYYKGNIDEKTEYALRFIKREW